MRIALLNVIFSENLGDGLLAQSLEQQLIASAELRGQVAQVTTFDLAGRIGFDTSGAAGPGPSRRALALLALSKCPAPLRRMVVGTAIGRRMKALRPVWDAAIENCDAVVIGGGNLFQDDDLNFPTKITAVLELVRHHGKPLAVYGVGVGKVWSAPATVLFSRLGQTRLVHATVRDARSRDHWVTHLPGVMVPDVVPDPALGLLWAERARLQRGDGAKQQIGLCITAPMVLARHATGAAEAIPVSTIARYAGLVAQLASPGRTVTLFTNGAQEDEAALDRVLRDPRLALGQRLIRAIRPRKPDALLRIIAGQDVIVAHRLHACIAAVALSIPAIGIDWDSKVSAFFASVGRCDNCLPAGGADASILPLIGGATDGVKLATQTAQLRAASNAAVTAMFDKLTVAVSPKG